MRTTQLTHIIILDTITLKSGNYEAPHCTALSILQFDHY